VVKIVGGTLLLTLACKMILGKGSSDRNSKGNVAIYPMGTHLLAGPGCISVVIIAMDKATASSDSLLVVLAILAVQTIALIAMLLANRVVLKFGGVFAKRLGIVMGFVLSYLAISMIYSGVSNF